MEQEMPENLGKNQVLYIISKKEKQVYRINL